MTKKKAKVEEPGKEKTCFVIMPISDSPNYKNGHFTRVYEHLIKPACDIADFIPIRADDVSSTNYIALDIIKKIIECDMALCDMSSQNPNVLYELGIRQAFNLPVSLMKDMKTNRVFDTQGFRDIEYDESLRVDLIEKDIEKLAKILVSTYEEKDNDVNSLISLLSIKPAKVTETSEISIDTKLILNSITSLGKRIDDIENSTFSKLTDDDFIVSQDPKTNIFGGVTIIPGNINDDVLSFSEVIKLSKGDKVFHIKFGVGEIVKIYENATNPKVEILFKTFGLKKLIIRFVKLRKVLDE